MPSKTVKEWNVSRNEFMIPVLIFVSLFLGCANSTVSIEKRGEISDERLDTISKYVALGENDKAIEAYEEAARSAPETAATRILHVRLLILASLLDEAMAEIDEVLRDEPQNADALYAKSLIFSMLGDKKNQEVLLERVVLLSPDHSEALASLGALYFDEKKYPRAKELFLKAVLYDDENLTAILGLGNVFYKEKKWQDAKAYFDRALVVAPSYSFAYSDRALVKRAMGDLAGALEDLNQAVRLEPDYSYNYYDRGRIFLDQGKLNDALREFTMAIDLDPELFAAYVMRAGVYDDLGNTDAAIDDYEAVLNLRKDYFYAYSLLGTLYMMREQYQKAYPMFDKALTYEPAVFEYALLAALALKKGGKNDDAVNYLNKKKPLIPKDRWQYEVALFYITPSADFGAVSAASREKNTVLRGRILYYLGAQFALLNKIATAKTYLSETARIDRSGLIEKRLAQSELQKLGGE